MYICVYIYMYDTICYTVYTVLVIVYYAIM